jgi:uncharacterized protein YqgV (UPF0045/DUF77 family)
MKVTLEISMYPLRSDYQEQVLSFLEELHRKEDLEIKVNAMSTQVKGEFDQVFSAIQQSIKAVYSTEVKASFVVKVLKGDLDLGYEYGK